MTRALTVSVAVQLHTSYNSHSGCCVYLPHPLDKHWANTRPAPGKHCNVPGKQYRANRLIRRDDLSIFGEKWGSGITTDYTARIFRFFASFFSFFFRVWKTIKGNTIALVNNSRKRKKTKRKSEKSAPCSQALTKCRREGMREKCLSLLPDTCCRRIPTLCTEYRFKGNVPPSTWGF